jgi:hypothetical protein
VRAVLKEDKMKRMARTIAAFTLLVSTRAVTQVVQIEPNNPAPRGHDPDRMVCEVEQTTGTRLGARTVCKTALEWQQLREEHRQTVDAFEQKNTSVGCQEGNPCSGGVSPH